MHGLKGQLLEVSWASEVGGHVCEGLSGCREQSGWIGSPKVSPAGVVLESVFLAWERLSESTGDG